RYYRQTEKDVLNKFFLHTVFIGNPGTGKTTVARILTKIYKALGILERGHMIETDRQGLVAGYVGQTAIKTAEKIEESMGGVLFIDEAYSLMEGMAAGGRGGFGDEAIQTLLKRMEDHRGQFFVFVAGYPDNMEAFLKANPGLNSRFDKTLKFDDYSPQDLFQIGLHMLKEENLTADPDAEKHLENYFTFLHNYRDKYFGNARTVRNVIQEVIKAHNLRLAALTPEQREGIPEDLITIEDASVLKTDKSDFVFNKKTMGFKKK
ncbi:MAG: AAA family ATPase, partial [Bacteroidetes bacterium]